MARRHELRIGCSGWNYPHWREAFYPKGMPARAWLAEYARQFNTVEVNNSFYRLPTEATVAGWTKQSPDGFMFAIKVSRFLTHVRRLRDVAEGVKHLDERIAPLRCAGKLGPLLWQLPGTFRRDDGRLEAALRALPAGRNCFEFRHESWFCDDVYELLGRHGVALVIGDTPERPFQTQELTAKFTFIRFHYGSRGRDGNYSDGELREWAKRIGHWRRQVDVFAYFNNDWNAYAPRNAKRLRKLLAG
jgi:uncharacterized protein YecE (DUF72 family)